MTVLIIKPEMDASQTLLQTDNAAEITDELAKRQVRFEQWQSHRTLPVSPDQEAVLDACHEDVDKIRQLGFDTVDVVSLHPEPENPDWSEKASSARRMFLSEHTHEDDEVRFFVQGGGCFYLRINGEVLIALCEQGDLIWIPAGTRHWFDMGSQPSFTAIRFFKIPEGWVGNFTGDDIATRFPSFDELKVA